MGVSKKQRKNLTLRLQPYEGTVLGEVVDYLNELDKDDVNRRVAEILTICLLPLARYERGLSEQVVRFSTLESCNALAQHAHFLRQVVGVGVELPVELPVHQVKSNVNNIQSKLVEEIEAESQQLPQSEFGAVDGLDDLFG
jgi:hypothetical protein